MIKDLITRTIVAGDSAGDKRLDGRGSQTPFWIRRIEGRRLDRVRLLDLFRGIPFRRPQPRE
jgi:hypothetical protein